MKKFVLGGLAALALSALAASPAPAEGRRFIAQLAPIKGVLPTDSSARGTATFELSADRRKVEFAVAASGVVSVTQIHIHVGEAGTTIDGTHYHLPPEKANGPIAVFLLDYVPDGISGDGTLAKGSFTAADLRGPFKGQSLATFIEHMYQGATYVNIHVDRSIGEGCCPSCLQGVIRAK